MKLGRPPLPTGASPGEVADWAELATIRGGTLSRGKLTNEVSRGGGTDRVVSDAWQELEERVGLSGAMGVFTISESSLELRLAATADLVLPAFLAALGLRENVQNSHRTLFEQCVSEIVKALVPASIRIGFPRRAPVPSPFGDALGYYASNAGECLVKRPRTSDNDLGMDVVAWRPFDDGRGGCMHLVGQCATGADWEEKLADLNLDVIEDHLNWAVRPVRFFATPHVVPAQHLRRASKRGGLILDRPRLLELERGSRLEDATRTEVTAVMAGLY